MDDDSKMTERKLAAADDNLSPVFSAPQPGTVSDNSDSLQRHLGNRHIQLLAIGGAVGTTLFISIGNGLAAGGPGSLFIAFVLWSLVVASVNNSITEMVVLQPVSGGFIRIAGYWFDDALGFMVGWNFFFFEVFAIPFEIAAVNLVLTYWTDKIPVAAVCAACIILYAYAPLFSFSLRILPAWFLSLYFHKPFTLLFSQISVRYSEGLPANSTTTGPLTSLLCATSARLNFGSPEAKCC